MVVLAIFRGALTLIFLDLGHLMSLKRTNFVPLLDGYHFLTYFFKNSNDFLYKDSKDSLTKTSSSVKGSTIFSLS